MTNPTPHGQVPEALRLAYELEIPIEGYPEATELERNAAAELRRLHAYCQELESQVIRDCMTHVQNPAEIEHVAGDLSKNEMGSNMTQQPAPAGAIPKAAQIEAIWGAMDCPAPATQQAGEVRPVTPYTCPKCHALWLHWPAEQTGFGRDTLNCRSADHCHYCEKAGVEQLQRLERIPAALHAPQPSPTAQAAESVPAVDGALEVADAMVDSQYLAGVSAGWNAANADDPNAALQKLHASRAGYLKPLVAARDPAESVLEDAARLERERICAAIKAEDDYCVDHGDYMLDSDDCIKIVRGEWVRPDFSVDAARKQGANHDNS